MRAPYANEQEAISRVAARPEGLAILEYLKANMDDTLKQLVQNNDPHQTRSLQGEARVLSVLLQVWKS